MAKSRPESPEQKERFDRLQVWKPDGPLPMRGLHGGAMRG
jgi:hypothetical protein